MKYYGIDIHKKYSVYTAVDHKGVILKQGRIANEPELFKELMQDNQDETRAVIEATANWGYIHDILEDLVDDVVIAHPLRTKAIASARIKTDKIDATTLAQLLRVDMIPESYIPPRDVRELRELLRYRAGLVRIHTLLKNKTHAVLIKTGFQNPCSDLFGKKGREWLGTIELKAIYRQEVDGFLRIIDFLKNEIIPISHEIDDIAKADPRAKILESIPGIGHYSAMLILSEIGDIKRFPSAQHLVSYAGLNPSVHSSGGVTRYGRITKQGSAWLRWVLVQCASTASRKSGRFSRFHRRIAFRHGAKTANVALAREILRICYFLLKKGERYIECSG